MNNDTNAHVLSSGCIQLSRLSLRILIGNQALAATCCASILVRRVPFLMLRQRYLKKGEVHELEGRSMKEITEAMGISGRGRKGADLPRPTDKPVWTGPVLRPIS